MKRAFYLIPSLVLVAGCATTSGSIDICRGADLRRATYTSAIVAVDAYTASGRPVPAAMVTAREAAVVALTVLNGNCPVQPQ